MTAKAKVKAAIIENMARNLSRHPEKQLASDFLAKANRIRKGAIRSMQAAWHRAEVREAAGKPAATMATQLAEKQNLAAVNQVAAVVKEQQKAVNAVAQKIAPTVKRAASTPQKSETEIIADFAAAIAGAGLHVKGPPIMDGKLHRASVDGDRGKATSGSYIGHLNGRPAGYIHNFKTGEEVRWLSSGRVTTTPEKAEARITRIAADRAARAAERKGLEEKVAGIAQRTWKAAMPAVRHPYMQKKGILAHWLRQDRKGNLLVPLQDAAGKIWNLQTIAQDGTKMYGVMAKDDEGKRVRLGGRKQGLYAVLGGMEPGKPLFITEGLATGATLYETTALTSVVAFDSGNLLPVAKTIRGLDENRPIIFAADNDHHLPRREPPLPNVGIEKAHEAAREVRGKVLAPKFEPHDRSSDWNDYAAQHGRRVANEHIRQSLAEMGVQVPAKAQNKGQEL